MDKPESHSNPYVEPNPYAAPEGPIGLEAIPGAMDQEEADSLRRRYLNHEASVKAVGSLTLLGALVWSAVALMMFAAAAGLITNLDGRFRELGEDSLAIGIAGGFFLIIATLFGVVGIGLRKLSSWGRWTEVVLSSFFTLLSLIRINPVSLGFSVYILYLMLSAKGAMVFSAAYKDVIAQTPHIKYRISAIVKVLVVILVSILATLVLVGVLSYVNN